MNKTVLIIITFGLIVALGIIFTSGDNKFAQKVEIIDGVQYVTVTAQGGYFPNVSNAKAGIPTKLIMKTNGTFDCSAALVIKSLDYQKILPKSGETEIDIGIPKAGEPLQGVCGMGMYSFQVNFED